MLGGWAPFFRLACSCSSASPHARGWAPFSGWRAPVALPTIMLDTSRLGQHSSHSFSFSSLNNLLFFLTIGTIILILPMLEGYSIWRYFAAPSISFFLSTTVLHLLSYSSPWCSVPYCSGAAKHGLFEVHTF
jgi:hypothetical protein